MKAEKQEKKRHLSKAGHFYDEILTFNFSKHETSAFNPVLNALYSP